MNNEHVHHSVLEFLRFTVVYAIWQSVWILKQYMVESISENDMSERKIQSEKKS